MIISFIIKNCWRDEFPIFLAVAHQKTFLEIILAPALSMSKIYLNISSKTSLCENAQ